MITDNLGRKQALCLRAPTKRINIWVGAVRSGKTYVSLLVFLDALLKGPEGPAMIIGSSRDALQRNILGPLSDLLNFPAPTSKASSWSILGRIIHLVGANDERAERKIRGVTLALAYVDEVTLIPESFITMLLSRLSIPGAKFFGTTNPDSPFHWLKVNYIDRVELDIQCWNFSLEDNPILDQEYVANLKREYTGLWYQRFIESKWVQAEGTVYDFFDQEEHVRAEPPAYGQQYIVGVDYGTANPTGFVLVGINRSAWPNIWAEKEYFYDSRKAMRQKTDTEYAEDLANFISNHTIRAIYMDPSAASFKNECRNMGIQNIYDADNDVINGIRHVSQLLANGAFKLTFCCKNLMRVLGTYVWDSKAGNRGIDQPLKENDHLLDALRYALYTYSKKGLDHITADDLRQQKAKALGFQDVTSPFYQPMQRR